MLQTLMTQGMHLSYRVGCCSYFFIKVTSWKFPDSYS